MSNSNENDGNETHSFMLTVSNKMGVHARPAAMIVRIASRYSGEIWVTKNDEKVNAKSIIDSELSGVHWEIDIPQVVYNQAEDSCDKHSHS